MKTRFSILLVVSVFVIFGGVPVSATTIDFDALTPGSVVGTIEGVTFTSSVSAWGLDLIVSDIFDTTSGENYLGVGDGGWEVFLPLDVVTLTFDVPVTSLTVDFISSPVTPGGVFSIETDYGSSSSGTVSSATLPDWGEAFTVSFSSATAFTSADLVSADFFGSYNMDTIDFTSSTPIPEPATLLLMGSALGLSCLARRRKWMGQ